MKYYKPAYAYTCYKAQGKTLYEGYNIHNCEHMSFREMLVSLSRATKFEDVHFDYELIKDKIFIVENCDDVIEQVNLKKCKLGYIYMLYSNKLQILNGKK